MLHQFKKKYAMSAAPALPSWDPFSELRRLFKQNALLAMHNEEADEKQQTETKPVPRKASAEA